MAQKTIVTMVDDITGEPFARTEGQTISFAVNGHEYEIDLNRENTKKFNEAMAVYTEHARRVGTARRRPLHRTPVPTSVDTSAVRAWAAAHGIPVSARGRISADVIEQFRAAGN